MRLVRSARRRFDIAAQRVLTAHSATQVQSFFNTLFLMARVYLYVYPGFEGLQSIDHGASTTAHGREATHTRQIEANAL